MYAQRKSTYGVGRGVKREGPNDGKICNLRLGPDNRQRTNQLLFLLLPLLSLFAPAARAQILSPPPSLAGADVVMPGVKNCDITSYWIKGAGDVNRDGHADFLIGALNAGSSSGNSTAASPVTAFAGEEAQPLPQTLDLSQPGPLEKYYLGVAMMRQETYVPLDSTSGSPQVRLAQPQVTYCRPDGKGVTYLIFGKEGGIGADRTLSLAHLNGANGVAFGGERGNDDLGSSNSGIGDINGDGYDDLCIGAPWGAELAPNRTGYAYIVFGAASSRWEAFPKLTSFGPEYDDVTGASLPQSPSDLWVKLVGGINVDYGLQITYPTSAAGFYLIGGGGAGFGPLIPSPSPSSPQYLDKPVVFDPTNPRGCHDYAVDFDPAGKIVLVDYSGLPSDCTFVSKVRRAQDAGAIAVVVVNRSAYPYPFLIPQDETISSDDPIVIPSVMVGADTGDLLKDAAATGGARVTLYPTLSLSLGHEVSGAGDVDGDGLDDLTIALPFADGVGVDGQLRVNSGVAYVVYGHRLWPTGQTLPLPLLRQQGLATEIVGPYDGYWAGTVASGAGDVNGDGYADIVIGAAGANILAGEAYLIFGSPNRIGDSSGLLDLRYLNEDQNGDGKPDGIRLERIGLPVAQFGGNVAGAGDTNGDGYSDFLVSAYLAGDAAGESYLFLGGPDGLPTVDGTFSVNDAEADPTNRRMIRFTGNSITDRAGIRLGGAGDVNGDGLGDFLIGADSSEPGDPDCCNLVYPPSCPDECNYGSAYLILGTTAWDKNHWYLSTDGCTNDPNAGCILSGDGITTPAFRMIGIRANDHAGIGANGAGDVDGDGLADFIAGAAWDRWNHQGTPRPGEAYLLYGKTDVPAAGYTAFIRSGANYPPLTFTPKIGIGLPGTGAEAIPSSRCWIQYRGGSDPANPNGSGASRDSAEIHRTAAGLAGDGFPAQVADVYWKVETTRTDWKKAIITLKYTDPEIEGLDESALAVYGAPSPAGPWTILPSLVLADVNEIAATTGTVGYFLIGAE